MKNHQRKMFHQKYSERPDVLIIFGGWNFNKQLNYFSKYLKNKKQFYNLQFAKIGERNGKNIVVAVCYGPSMVSEIANIFCHLGVKNIFVTGTFGGLKPDIKIGDILVVEKALREDGASEWYLPKNINVTASEILSNKIKKALSNRGEKYFTGNVITVPSILGTLKSPIDLSSKAIGTDMETATVFTVAKTFNVSAVSILIANDNLVMGKKAYEPKNNQEKKEKLTGIKKTVKIIFEVIDKL